MRSKTANTSDRDGKLRKPGACLNQLCSPPEHSSDPLRHSDIKSCRDQNNYRDGYAMPCFPHFHPYITHHFYICRVVTSVFKEAFCAGVECQAM